MHDRDFIVFFILFYVARFLCNEDIFLHPLLSSDVNIFYEN